MLYLLAIETLKPKTKGYFQQIFLCLQPDVLGLFLWSLLLSSAESFSEIMLPDSNRLQWYLRWIMYFLSFYWQKRYHPVVILIVLSLNWLAFWTVFWAKRQWALWSVYNKILAYFIYQDLSLFYFIKNFL